MKNYHQAERIELVQSGSNYFEVLENLIDDSEENIQFQTYIFDYDKTGKKIIASLVKASLRGVKVFALADAFGSSGLPSSAVKVMRAAGISFRFFSPLFSAEGISFGRRLHHKIVVVDGKRALLGGINIADKYQGAVAQDPWLDYAVRIEGKLCGQLTGLCKRIYDRKPGFLHREMERRKTDHPGPRLVRFRRNDWLLGKNEIHKSYLEALIGAEKSITLVASYFLPGRVFRKLLQEAAERGVEIKIILAGKSDVPVIYLAEKYLYNFYLRNRIQIYLWHNSVMHGKAMTVDGSWATIGSYNLNSLSHYLSIELNADIRDKTFVGDFNNHLETVILEKCVKIDGGAHATKIGILERIKMRLGYLVYKVMMRFMLGRKKRDAEKTRRK